MVSSFKTTAFFVFALLLITPAFISAQNDKPAKRDTVYLEGFISSDQTLSEGKVYVLKFNVKVGKNATLTVPGNTKLLLDFNASIVVEGGLNFNGSPNSYIEVSSRDPKSPGGGVIIRGAEGKDININYTKFTQVNTPLRFDNDWYRSTVNVQHSAFTNIFTGEPVIYIVSPPLAPGRRTKFVFSNNSYVGNWGSIFIDNFQSDVMDLQFTDNLLTNNVVYAIKQGDPSNALIYGMFDDVKSKYQTNFSGNSIFGNYQINSSADTIIREVGIGIQGSGESLAIPDNFFRSTDANYVSSTFDHFYQNSSLPLLQVEPIASNPRESVPPHIYKVNLNGKDITNYSSLPPASARDAIFEVYFNKEVEAVGDKQFESIVYDTARNELVVNPVQTVDNKWSPDHRKYSFRVSNASFLNNNVGYVVISNFKDNEGATVPQFVIGQQKALNNYRAFETGGRKTAELISKPGQDDTGIGVDIDKGAFLQSKEQVNTLKQLTNLGDLSYLGPYESLAKSWEAGLMLGASNYTGTMTDRFADRNEYHLAGGVFGQYNRHKWYSLRAMLWFGKISGNDLTVSTLSDRRRLSEFKNFIVEGSITFHWHLLPYGTNRGEKFVPSIFAGISLFRNNPMSRIWLTLDRAGDPVYLRWKDGNIVTDWRYNTDGYNEGKDIWVYLRDIGTEGQTVPGDKVDPEANSNSPDAAFFQDRTAPKKYSKVQVAFPVGFELSWLINNRWNIGATLGVRFTTSRYLDDIGGYFFDRINGHQAIIDANLGKIKDKAGREKVTLPDFFSYTDDQNLLDTFFTAALISNPSLAKTNEVQNPNFNNYAYAIDQPYDTLFDNHDARRARKNFDNYDLFFFGGVKVSYVFKRKGQQKTTPKVSTAKDGYVKDSDGDGIPDEDERKAGTNPNKADSDGDGLSDKKESEAGTKPNSKDSDGDGAEDGKDKCPTIAGSKKNDGCPE